MKTIGNIGPVKKAFLRVPILSDFPYVFSIVSLFGKETYRER